MPADHQFNGFYGKDIISVSQFDRNNLDYIFSVAHEMRVLVERFGSADLTMGTHSDPNNPIERIFTRTWTVKDDSPVKDMKSVTVNVTYTSGSKDNSATLTTYLTSRR